MPPNKISSSLKVAFAAINAYILFRAEPQSFDTKKYFMDTMGKDDVFHSIMRLVLLHYSADFRPKRVDWVDSDFDTGFRKRCFPVAAEISKSEEDPACLRMQNAFKKLKE